MRGILLSCLLLSATAQAEVIHDDELGLTFTVPVGFAKANPPTASVRYAFQRGEPGQPGWAMIALQPLTAPVERGPLEHDAFERGVRTSAPNMTDFRFEYGKTRWHDFELDLAQFHARAPAAELASLAVTVPLEPKALNLMAMGVSGDDEPRLRKDLEGVLAGIDGKSNWLSAAERSERLGFLVGLLFGIPLAIWLVVWLKRRRARA